VWWIEADDIYSKIKTSNANYLLSYSLKYVEQSFPDDLFIRIHRSYMANIKMIDAIEEKFVIIQNHQIPIGKTYKEALLKRLSIF
jgi:DNA-binding LytR/AlgR family response regulator